MTFIHLCCFLTLISGLSSCTAYYAKPLEDKGQTLSLTHPDKNRLIHKAASLHHERLAPIKIDFTKPLNVEQLAVLTVLFNPDLIAQRAKVGVAKAQAFDAGLLPDPQIGFNFDKPMHQTNPPTIPIATALGLSLSWDIASLLTRDAKLKSAYKKYQQTHYDVAWQEWLLANQAQLMATRLYFLQQQRKVLKDNLIITKSLWQLTEQLMQRHDATLDTYAARQAAYLDLEDQLVSVERTIFSTQIQLNQLLGLRPDERLNLARPRLTKTLYLNAEQLFQQAKIYRLDLLALRAGYESQEQTLYQQVLGQFPHFNLNLTRARDTGSINTLGSALSFDVPLFNRNRGAIAIAQTTREQLYLEYQARLRQTQSEISALVRDLRALNQEEKILTQQLPHLQQMQHSLLQELKTGNITQIAYQSSLADILSKKLKLLAIRQNKAEQYIALQIAQGRLDHD